MPPLINEGEGDESRAASPFEKDSETFVKVPIDRTFSDGDENQWPTDPKYISVNPNLYMKKLATMWMKQQGKAVPGQNYILDKLPDGYALMSRPRRLNPDIYDKFLYGHPSRLYFNSPNRFWPHFLFLMSHGSTPCRCDLCTAPQKPASSASGVSRGRGRGRGRGGSLGLTRLPEAPSKHAGRPKVKKYLAEDQEGTEDKYKTLVYELKMKGKLDRRVREDKSMDWRAEREQMELHLTRMSMQHSFIPRHGELVFFCPRLAGELRFNFDTDRFEVYAEEKRRFLGPPEWRAGTVAQVPEEPVVLADVISETPKRMAINMSGFRVETFPDPNDTDKSLSSQYSYLPMHAIRPLNYWRIFLQGVPEESWHPSIKYALTIMSSFSVLEKYNFKGNWPNAAISCKGVYLGSELLLEGDSVRLMPQDQKLRDDPDPEHVTDVLSINRIKYDLKNCNADISSPLLSEKMAVRFIGKAYTLSPNRAYRPEGSHKPTALTRDEVVDSFRCVGMSEYGPWYHLHDPKNNLKVSMDEVVGRCFESELMEVMFGDLSLGLDLESVISGREYGRLTDQRIPPGKEWFPGDYRLETLALETLNGIEVGTYDDARDLKMWRANLNIIDKTATAADLKAAKIPRAVGRPREGLIGGKTKTFLAFESVGKTSTMVSSSLGPPGTSTNATPSAQVSEEEEEGGDVDEESSESDESDPLAAPLQPTFFRGGTEESSGGDYRPVLEPTAKRRKHN
ncbi:hypothetical protein AJ80_06526 [Polytolypa hystricis UAMH7299]|uniref:Cryptic loci regulator 2 N-terminal domain-containing protein n=1 Tax=Polytolypa hystricis (strain UAMH7299) TaxID=1447883 RepID=A0A2B7XVY1_POLH7|nr:hypothetical protein AJ80_06526 [Polytolypa hystricis UAMH7299]